MPEEMPKAAGTSENKLLAALCYIIAVLVPLFVIFTEKKNDKFLAFHAWQSLLYSIAWIVVFFLLSILIGVVSVATAGIGTLLGCLYIPVSAVAFLYGLFLAYKAYQGEKIMAPVIGEYAQKQVK